MKSYRPLIPQISDTTTDAVRVPRTTEQGLTKLLGRPVRIRTQTDLAHTLLAVLQAAVSAKIADTVRHAQSRTAPADTNDPTQ